MLNAFDSLKMIRVIHKLFAVGQVQLASGEPGVRTDILARNDIADFDILYALTAKNGRNEKEIRKIW